MKHDLKKLKDLNPIAPVIQETAGYELYPRDADGRWLACVQDPDLKIDLVAGRWYRGQESGDVINWLMGFYVWPFRKALDFLDVRGGRPEAERLALQLLAGPPELEKASTIVAPVLATAYGEGTPGHELEMGWTRLGPEAWAYSDPLEDIKDGRVRKALKLLEGVPRAELDDLVLTGKTRNHQTIFEFLAWVPQHFMPAFGYYEYCAGCYQDFDDWGDYFYAIDEGEGKICFEEVYCPGCVKKFQRWYQGRELLFSYLRSQGLLYPE
jgi:hypothetical protein